MTVARPPALHLARLSQATPDEALDLPESGGALCTLHLTRKRSDEAQGCWYVCLSGELLIDLPHGNFVHLRAQETCRVPEGVARTLTPVREATVLVITLPSFS
ncbi:hypothetical protein [Deinococcus peraridilitoris]|uniref:Cupin domain-containing protein n=1 Tax=Deinococcus peraridilitoris (strain DSM 19664 / LMG 22246 / CIP 109416 / KR-200) TaxID=937777 RepID=L0A5L0_DEIPD|nr:hypothetical protein [Deinococcus peraridilitoris]AFZ68724.1 hypothetical protein Deipe_3283 [Deinococcus peraridilitoris DSM 19664]